MTIKIHEPKTPKEFERYYDLRWRILRKPWNQTKGSEKDNLEEKSIHVMACEGRELLGVGRVHFNNSEEAQIRYMAVEEERRQTGVGSLILKELEKKATLGGAKILVLNAREEAVAFYRKHGYEVSGPAPTLFGSIKHFRMQKSLNKI